MQAWEEKALERLEGKAEGKAEGILDFLSDLGFVSEDLKNEIFAEKDLEKLKKWLKLAARSRSIEEFREKYREI